MGCVVQRNKDYKFALDVYEALIDMSPEEVEYD